MKKTLIWAISLMMIMTLAAVSVYANPLISEITPVTTPTNDNTPSYTFNSNETGAIAYAGGCTSPTVAAVVGNNAITFNALADGTYAACTITVTGVGGPSNVLSITPFTVDTVAPVLAQVTAITTPTNDNTPTYTFSSTEAGSITYAGGCTSATVAAVVGNNAITYNALADGTYAACTIRVTDAAGNPSLVLAVPSFRVDTVAPTVTSITANDHLLTESDVGVAHFNVAVVFNENMNVGVNPTIVFNPTVPTTLTNCAGVWTNINTYTVTCDVADSNAEIAGVDVQVSNAQDQATNPMAGTYTKSNEFDIDMKAPGIFDLTSGNPTTGEQFIVSGQAIDGFQVTAISETITTTPAVAHTTTITPALPTGAANFQYTLNIPPSATSLVYTITATDSAGQVNTLGPITTYVLDNDAPTVAVPTTPTSGWYRTDIPVSVGVTDNIGVNTVNARLEGATNYNIALAGPTPYTGTFVIAPITDGTYTLRIIAADAAGNVNQGVTVANIRIDDTLPVLNSLTSNIVNNITKSASTVTYTLTFVEANVNTVTLSAGTSQPMAVVGGTATYTGTPASLGCPAAGETTCTVTATVTDLAGNSATKQYSFKIDNNNPIITINAVNPTPVYNNISANVSAQITDANLNTIALSENSTGAFVNHNLALHGTGVYSYVIPSTNSHYTDGQVITYIFTATDMIGNTNTVTQTFTVQNRAPVYVPTITDKTINEGQAIPTFNIAGNFKDADMNAEEPNGDNLDYYYTVVGTLGQISITINNATGDVNIVPTNVDYFGVSQIIFVAVDQHGATAQSGIVTITYVNVNDAPRLIGSEIPDVTFAEDSSDNSIVLNQWFYDPDGDPIHWDWYSPNSNIIVNINPVTTRATISATPNWFGTTVLTFRANDNVGGEGSDTINVNITSVPDAPVINDTALTNQSILNLTKNEDFATYTFNLAPYVSDADPYDAGNLRWKIAGVDNTIDNIVVTPAGLMTFTSVANAYGTDQFQLTVNDTEGLTDTITLTMAVNSVNDAPVISAAMPTTYNTNEDTALAINLKPYESDVDPYDTDANLRWSVSGVDTSLMTASMDVANDILLIMPVADMSGSNIITLTLTDSMGATAQKQVTINILPVNDAPRITSVAPTTATQGVVYTYDMNATDVENDLITYSANNTAFAVNAQSGLITWTPTQADVNAGHVTVTFTATDSNGAAADQVVTINVNNANDNPVFVSTPIMTATQDVPYNYQANATDVDGDVLAYSLDVAPTGMVINVATGMITWVPLNANVGNNQIVVRVVDGKGGFATQPFAINVANVNDAPIITTTAPTGATQGVLYVYDLNATDADGDVLTYVVNDTHFTINPANGITTWTPTQADVNAGHVTVMFTVSDPNGGVATETATIAVANSNDNPVIPFIADATATEGVAFTYDINATDVDAGNILTYSLTAAPAGMVIDPNSGIITWVPQNANVGNNNVRVHVIDQFGGFADSNVFIVYVQNVNNAPVITTTAPTTATQGVTYVYDLNATDADPTNDVLTYSITSGPAGMTINPANGLVQWTPGQADVIAGTRTAVFTVTDNHGASVNQTATITVSNTNDAPVIISLPVTTAIEHSLYKYQVNATDADNDPITYSLVIKKGDMNIDPVTGLMTWIPEESAVGNNNVAVMASDNHGGSFTQTFTITVANVNDPPTVPVLTAPADGSVTYTNVMTLRWQASTDPDSVAPNTVSYKVYHSNNATAPAYYTTTSATSTVVSGLQDTTDYYWYVVATDGSLDSAPSATWHYTTSLKNAPNITSHTPASLNVNMQENSTQAFSFTAVDYNVPPQAILYSWIVDGVEQQSAVGNSGTYTYAPDFSSAGNHVVKLVANNTYGVSSSVTWNINVANLNRLPQFINLPAQYDNITQGQNFQIDFSGMIMDPDEPATNLHVTTTSQYVAAQNGNRITVRFPQGGNYDVVFRVTDSLGGHTDATLHFVIIDINEAPVITASAPAASPIYMTYFSTMPFSVTATDPENDPLTTTWYVDGTQVSTGDTYTYLGDGKTGMKNMNVTVQVTDGQFIVSKSWNLIQTSYPIADTFNGATTDFSALTPAQIKAATNITLEVAGVGKIEMPGPIDLSNVAVIDGFVSIQKGVVAVNTAVLTPFVGKPARITLYGLNYPSDPMLIYYNNGFTTSRASFTNPCTTSSNPSCTLVSRTAPPTTQGTVVFDINHFTSFMVVSNNAPKITSAGITTAYVNEAYSYDVQATDVDGDALTYSLVESPAGMTIDAGTGLISWTPTTYTTAHVKVEVKDSNGAVDDQSFSVKVTSKPQLYINDIKVKVDSKSSTIEQDGDSISKEAAPGSTVKFTINACNNFTDAQDIKINSVNANVNILNIDDGSDIDQDATSQKDISAGHCQKFDASIDIPYNAAEDTYDVEVTVDGDDENNNVHKAVWNIALDVKRENHQIIIRQDDLMPTSTSCGISPILGLRIENIGQNDESDASVRIQNSDLGVDLEETGISLSSDGTSSDSSFNKDFQINIGQDVAPGTYPLTITTYYSGKQSDTKTVDLDVTECTRTTNTRTTVPVSPMTEPPTTTYEPAGDVSVEIIPGAYSTIPAATVNSTSFLDSDEYTLLLIAIMVMVLGIGIFIIGYVALKK